MEVSMRKTFVTLLAVVAGLVIASRPMAAHHGAAAFENDPAKRLVLKGTVVQWIWSNPHTFLQFDVRGADGQPVRWVVEASNPPDMQNRGWTNKSFKAGDEVTVTVRPVKSGRPVGSIIQVQFADGHVLSAVGGGGNEPVPARP
jgi:phosphodiesterase/alkaline phosphatase D-like protein